MKVGLMLPIGEQEKTGKTLSWSPPNAAAVRELGRAAEIARADARIAAHG